MVALNKVGSYYLKKQFRWDALQFVEKFTNSVLSTFALVTDWTGVKWLLPCHPNCWKRQRAPSNVCITLGRTSGEGLVEG